MQTLTEVEKWKALVKYDPGQAAADFGGFDPVRAENLGRDLGGAFFKGFLLQLSSSEAADVLRNLPLKFSDEVLALLPAEKSAKIREILSYEPGTAGALMTKEYLSLPFESTIGEATVRLQALAADRKGKVSYIYVTDEQNRLQGVIQVRDLVFYPPATKVSAILKSPVVQVETGMSRLDVAKLLQRHRYLGLPVVDDKQRLAGVISADRALKIFEDEAEDDLAKIIGTDAEEIHTHSVVRILQLRMPWLSVNIFSGLLCALVFGIFQRDPATVVALFIFVPLVLGLSESIGVQGATIVVRNIALGNVAWKDLGALFLREVAVGVVVGAACGIIVGSVAGFWQGQPRLGLAIGASMALAIFISALIGLALPSIFRRFKIDPAMASGPLVLAVCDLQTLLVYFNLSGSILSS